MQRIEQLRGVGSVTAFRDFNSWNFDDQKIDKFEYFSN